MSGGKKEEREREGAEMRPDHRVTHKSETDSVSAAAGADPEPEEAKMNERGSQRGGGGGAAFYSMFWNTKPA